jgi:hypothetical protein
MIITCNACGIQVLGNLHMCPHRIRVWEVTCRDNPSSYVSAQSAGEAACAYAEEFDIDDVSTFNVRESTLEEWTDVVIHGLELIVTDI